MNKKIIFVTGNMGKFEEVKRWLLDLDPSIELEAMSLDIPEIQSLDIEQVAHDKALKAWQLLHKPLIVDDGGIYLTAYHQFPGALSKYVYEGIGLEGFWRLAQPDPRAYFMFNLVYVDEHGISHIFQGRTDGRVIAPSDDEKAVHAQLPYTKVFIPDGANKTMSALRVTEEDKPYRHRYKALKKFVAWLNQKK